GAEPAPGERQVIQRQVDPKSLPPGTVVPSPTDPLANPDPTQSQPAGGGMLGMAPRACRSTIGKGGKPVVICPTFVNTTQYYERQTQLEDAVKKAEDELEAAETAYRRGVD